MFERWLQDQAESVQAVLRDQDRTLLNTLLELAYKVGERQGQREAHEDAMEAIKQAGGQ